MRANRVDANQAEIVAHFREWGCSVFHGGECYNKRGER